MWVKLQDLLLAVAVAMVVVVYTLLLALEMGCQAVVPWYRAQK
jgi:hypothetical protein